jgi:hypothetical protein
MIIITATTTTTTTTTTKLYEMPHTPFRILTDYLYVLNN